MTGPSEDGPPPSPGLDGEPGSSNHIPNRHRASQENEQKRSGSGRQESDDPHQDQEEDEREPIEPGPPEVDGASTSPTHPTTHRYWGQKGQTPETSAFRSIREGCRERRQSVPVGKDSPPGRMNERRQEQERQTRPSTRRLRGGKSPIVEDGRTGHTHMRGAALRR